MTELQKIKTGISRKPKKAYTDAINSGSACVLDSRNTVVLVQKDGSRKVIIQLGKTRIRVEKNSEVAFP